MDFPRCLIPLRQRYSHLHRDGNVDLLIETEKINNEMKCFFKSSNNLLFLPEANPIRRKLANSKIMDKFIVSYFMNEKKILKK